MTLTDLLFVVSRGWAFTKKTYPRMDGDEKAFSMKHVAQHMGKATGKIVAAIEPWDHGKPIDEAVVRKQVAYSLVNTLKMASLAGMTEEDLLTAVDEWAADNMSVPKK